jgi:hypothetical protein
MRTAMEFPDDMPPFHVMRIVKAVQVKEEQRVKDLMKQILTNAKERKEPPEHEKGS